MSKKSRNTKVKIAKLQLWTCSGALFRHCYIYKSKGAKVYYSVQNSNAVWEAVSYTHLTLPTNREV